MKEDSDEASTTDVSRKGHGELHERYVCVACATCVATSESLLESQGDVTSFSALHQPSFGSRAAGPTVACPWCETELGSRSDAAVRLRKDRVQKRAERLEILLLSLKDSEMNEVAPHFREAFPHCNVATQVLKKAELRGFQAFSLPRRPDLVVVVARNEGRVLLTDRNGFYHDVLGVGWGQARGNVLVVLTRTPTGAGLYDEALLRNLATKGDQPTIGAVAGMGRVLTWESGPSGQQQEHVFSLCSRAYFREPPSKQVAGVPQEWLRPRSNSSNWCALL